MNMQHQPLGWECGKGGGDEFTPSEHLLSTSYQECPHHISIGCWRGTEISHWAEPWYLPEEASQNQPEVIKQAHSAILSSSLVSPFRQIKKLRIRVNDSPKIPQLVYGRAEFGLSSVQEKSHTLLCQHGRCLTSLGYICKVGVRC